MGSHIHSTKCSPASLEILKTLKQKFIGSELEKYQESKVWLRENGKLVIERPEDLWRDHYKRRRRNTRCGFFSSPSEPFKCLGGPLILDANELLHQSYPEELKGVKTKVKGALTRPKSVEHEVKSDLKEDKGCSEVSVVQDRPSEVGFSQIRDLLKIENERIIALKGGMPYMDHIKKIEKRLEDKKEKPINGMVLMSTSDFAFMFGGTATSPTESKISANEKKTAGDTESVVSVSNTQESDDGTESIRSADSLLRVKSGLTERLERMRRDNIEFLNSIHRLLTIARNLRTVDLRSRQHLSRQQLSDLEKSRKVERECKNTGISRLQKRQSADTTLSVDLFPTNITSHLENRNPSFFGPPKRRQRLLSMFGPTGPLLNLGSKPSAMVNDKTSRMLVESALKEPRVETWEDLLNVGTVHDSGETTEVPVKIIASNVVSRALKWSRFASKTINSNTPLGSSNNTNDNSRYASRNTNEESIEHRHTKPIWQIVANERPPSSFDEAITTNKLKEQQSVRQRARKNIEIVNKKLLDSCKEEVKKLNQNRIATFHYKFGTISSTNFTSLFDKHKWIMREPRDYGLEDPEQPETQLSKWLEELTERIFNTVGQDDPEITNALTKLRQYALLDIKTIPQIKAKLCLIVMSLPAYDICKISTQMAVRFILEKILQAPVEDFYHWLNLRKLPVVILK